VSLKACLDRDFDRIGAIATEAVAVVVQSGITVFPSTAPLSREMIFDTYKVYSTICGNELGRFKEWLPERQ